MLIPRKSYLDSLVGFFALAMGNASAASAL